ncbi:MAG TPA: M14 family zinc carboxypeptidase, partial [Longimicrobiales bacterium]|nr:M14 family zinc carboxypeptidase [Longimicrobiales bacterium]
MAAALVTLLLQAAVLQAGPFTQVLSPGTTYDPAIPTLEQVVGHDFHEEITPPDGIAAYLAALAQAAPERTRLVEYARSYEGRPLHVLVIGSAGRIARLDAVKEDLRRLA